MSVRGWATGAKWEDEGTELTADVSAAATTLHVEWAELFDNEGGILQLNGARLAYTTADDDADTVTMAAGLPDAAVEGDRVYVVEGGQVKRDYILNVDLGGPGDEPEVIIPFGDRDLWPEGDYDDPVPVLLSDDMERVESVPGRTPARASGFVVAPFTTGYLPADDSWPNSASFTTIDWAVADLGRGQMSLRPIVGGISAASLSVFEIEAPGVYDVRCWAAFADDGADAGRRSLRIRYDTAAEGVITGTEFGVAASGVTRVKVEEVIWLDHGDKVWFEASQTSGAALNLRGAVPNGKNQTKYSILKVAG